jgi:hypothetical protein
MRKNLGTIAIAIALATSGCGGGGTDGSEKSESEESPTSPSSPTTSATAGALPDFVARSIHVDGNPSEIVLGGGSLWVLTHRGATVTRIDPRTGRVLAKIKSPGDDLVGLAVSAGHVWFLDTLAQRVEAVDMNTERIDVSVIVHSDGGTFAPAPDGVWFAGVHGAVQRITVAGIAASYHLTHATGPALTPWMVGEQLAVADADHGRVTLLDSDSGTTMGVVRVGGDPGSLVADAQGLWVGNWSGPLFRVDGDATRVEATVPVPAVDHLVECGGRLWVRVSDTTVEGVDLSTAKVRDTYDELPTSEIPGGGLGCADGALWVVNWSDNSVWKIPLS